MELQKKQCKEQPQLAACNRCAHDAACGLRDQSKKTQAGERSVWLAEDDRIAAADGLPRKRTIGWMFTVATAVYNPARIRNLEVASAVTSSKKRPDLHRWGLSNSSERKKDKNIIHDSLNQK